MRALRIGEPSSLLWTAMYQPRWSSLRQARHKNPISAITTGRRSGSIPEVPNVPEVLARSDSWLQHEQVAAEHHFSAKGLPYWREVSLVRQRVECARDDVCQYKRTHSRLGRHAPGIFKRSMRVDDVAPHALGVVGVHAA